jgi:hypothetical protein
VVRSCVGHAYLVKATVAALRGVAVGADALGAGRAARSALGAIFNLLYWQGVSDELGGPQRVWTAVTLKSVPA